MKKKLLMIGLSLSLLLTSGCSSVSIRFDQKNDEKTEESVAENAGTQETGEEGTEEGTGEEPVVTGGTPWVDSELKENVAEDTPVSPVDDFHLYANKEWILNNEIPSGYSTWSHYSERELEVKKQCMELLKDESLTGHDAELIQTYNALILDWDARNAAGVSEIRNLYEKILAIETTEDVTELLTNGETSSKLYAFVSYGAGPGLNDPDRYLVVTSSPGLLLDDSAEYSERTELGDIYYAFEKEVFTYLAGKMGMEETEAQERFDRAIDIETVLSKSIYTTKETNADDYLEKINNEMSFEDVVALAKVFPLEEIMTSDGYKYDGKYLMMNPGYFETLDEVYTDANIDGIRDLILVKYLLGYAGLLDRETYEKRIELRNRYFGTSGSLPDEEMAYNTVTSALPASMQKVYISRYGSEEDKKKMEDLCRQVIDTYREMLSENEWASDEVKNYAIEKLDKMEIHAAYPDKFRDTSGLDLSGCSLIKAQERLSREAQDYNRSLIGTEVDKEMWAEDFDILSCNAFYAPNTNTINMIIGMMGDPFYSSDMSTEELYASIGAFWVGHEISHAFDSNGSQYDADGKYRDWWTEEDKKEFKRRVSKMDDYLDGIVAFGDKHFIGTNIDTEMVADMTGLQCALRMASKVEGFDYDKFFTKYANMNASLEVYSSELSVLMQDEHPLNYSRTNVPVQQFEEFYETYGVKEGDNMYLAPEDRLLIW
ncbi:MAG: M13 family metallopeptidase [Lachnospiraceae bacterium]|nr:M13 family metallopeptidase [Lachnospiraceae bacterium]